MRHQPPSFYSKAFLVQHSLVWGVASLMLVGCTSAELEVPLTHPGNAHARAGRIAKAEALSPAQGLDTSTSSTSASRADHAHHHHGAHVAPAVTGESTQPASQPAGASFTCPMHPEVVRAEPGKCPICGMSLVPKKDAK